jgi:hypothetical protein
MTQTTIDFTPTTQARELSRVSGRIAEAIVGFCRARVGQTFHADELRRWVEAETGTAAPGSADRVLRMLRQAGRVRYVVESRAESRYRVEGVA